MSEPNKSSGQDSVPLEFEPDALHRFQKLELRKSVKPSTHRRAYNFGGLDAFLLRDLDGRVTPTGGGSVGEKLDLACLFDGHEIVHGGFNAVGSNEEAVIL